MYKGLKEIPNVFVGQWSFYFFAKIYLYFKGFIRLDFLLNFLFLLFLLVPISQKIRFYRFFRMGKGILSFLFAFLLLWHDSWFPPLFETGTFFFQQGFPSGRYIFMFFLGLVNPFELMVLGVILGFCIWGRHYVRLTPLIILLLLIVPLRELGAQNWELDKHLEGFYEKEKERIIRFHKNPLEGPPYDVVILHVCSLAWADLGKTGADEHPFFNEFDLIFSRFNTATAYSNPSGIRLLRAKCGQPSHDLIYRDAPDECYLFDGLRAVGFQPQFLLNHDGDYGDFEEELISLGRLEKPLEPPKKPVRQIDFNGSPVLDDFTVLEDWWKKRQSQGFERVAIYYNTISLHDGGHKVGEEEWWKRDRSERYKEFVDKLFNDFSKFFSLIEKSGKNVVILFVPEHGFALEGNSLQGPGLRDIPLPRITTVPVGIKLIGEGFDPSRIHPTRVSLPVSYLSLSHVLSSFLKHNPFIPGHFDQKVLVDQIPETDFVAENQGAKVVEKDGKFYFFGKDEKWRLLKIEN